MLRKNHKFTRNNMEGSKKLAIFFFFFYRRLKSSLSAISERTENILKTSAVCKHPVRAFHTQSKMDVG